MHGKRGVAYLGGRHARDADVDGLGFHVLTVFGHAVAVFAEVVVAPRGAIAADDVDLVVGMA